MLAGASFAAALFTAITGGPGVLTAFITINVEKAYQVKVTTLEAVRMQFGVSMYWWVLTLLLLALNAALFVRARRYEV